MNLETRIISIKGETDIVLARGSGREAARDLGFGLADQTRLATAISELTRNILIYAKAGVCRIMDDSDAGRVCLRIEVEDNGPGIPDLAMAMGHGYSTGRGLGIGLPGARRLVHKFDVNTEPGHTKITMQISRERV